MLHEAEQPEECEITLVLQGGEEVTILAPADMRLKDMLSELGL
jgi:hypothetical protein